jgi:glycine oxidase
VEKEVDCLVVGGGLAGVWLAFQLCKRNKSFALIDKPGLSISSSVAAGIFNTILPARQKKSYNADLIYPELGIKYHEMEAFLGCKILNSQTVCHILDDQWARNDWAALAKSDPFSEYVDLRDDRISDNIISDYGYLAIRHSGRVDIQAMNEAFIKGISLPNHFINEEFDEDMLESNDEGIRYGDIKAGKLILCQGAGMNHNKLTINIPLKPAKGEVLLLRTIDEFDNLIPQNGVFMLPMGNKVYKVGSNFEWDDLSYKPTEKAKNEILRKFEKWYKGPFEIIDQQVGLRPSSEDRRPIIGKIQIIENTYVFNGLGSKGAALAPYYSEMLCKYLFDGGVLDPEADIRRLKIR